VAQSTLQHFQNITNFTLRKGRLNWLEKPLEVSGSMDKHFRMQEAQKWNKKLVGERRPGLSHDTRAFSLGSTAGVDTTWRRQW
jgi:hypothetical protein